VTESLFGAAKAIRIAPKLYTNLSSENNKTNYANTSDSVNEHTNFKSSDVQNTKLRRRGPGYYVEADVLGSPHDIVRRHIVDEMTPGEYARQLHKQDLKKPYPAKDHYQAFLFMNFHMERTIESLNNVASRLQEHTSRLQYPEYLEANLEDYSNTEHGRSETRKFLEAYSRRVRPLVEMIEQEVARYAAIENEKIRNANRRD
jgi:hypothetical protein